MTARGRLQRAAVRFTERRQAGAPGDVVELEAAARELAAAEPLADDERALLAEFRRVRIESRSRAAAVLELVRGACLDDLLADTRDELARWRSVGRQLQRLSPGVFRAALHANEAASKAISGRRCADERRARILAVAEAEGLDAEEAAQHVAWARDRAKARATVAVASGEATP